MQDLLRDDDLPRPVTVGLGRERDADRVADALLQQNGQRRRGGDDPLRSHARFGQSQVKRIVAAPRKLGINGDQVLNAGHLAGEDDPVTGQPERFGKLGAADRRGDQRLAYHVRRIEGTSRLRVLVHHAREQLLVEASPVDADAYRLAVLDRALDHHRELRIVPAALADVAGVDAIFRERPRAIRKIAEQLVPVEVEVADQRDIAAECIEPLANRAHGGRGFSGVDRNAHQFRAGVGQRLHLRNRSRDVDRVGVRHRLHDDR